MKQCHALVKGGKMCFLQTHQFIQVKVFWVMIAYVAVGYQHSGGPYCHPSLLLVGEDWTPHWPFCTCSAPSSTLHHSPLTGSITILSRFLLDAGFCPLLYSMPISMPLS